MNPKRFLTTYARAWETRDPELAAGLFHEDATYHENPFNEPIRSRAGIRDYWQGATAAQKDIRVEMSEPMVLGSTVIAEWHTRYTHIPSGERRELRGILLAEFKGERVATFREYWQRRAL